MDTYTAIGIAEGFIEAENEDQIIEAWQHLINTGVAWQLQGWFGRTAMYLIEEGLCKFPEEKNEGDDEQRGVSTPILEIE